MSSSRNGEHGNHPPFRSKRLYGANVHWYFDTRERTQFGPFHNPEEAKKALAFFVAQNCYKRAENGLIGDERPGIQDGIEHMVQEIMDILRCYTDFGALAADSWVRCRLEDLALNGEENVVELECASVLKYALDHAEQLFDTESFLAKGVIA